MATIDNLLTTKEAAKLLNVTHGRVRQLVVQERLIPKVRVGRNLLFDRRDIERFAKFDRPSGKHLGKS